MFEWAMQYLNQFLSLRCSGDVLNATAPISNGAKEITEAMGMRELVKRIVHAKDQNYVHIDLCSGNCLAPILSAFTFSNVYAFGVDLRKPRDSFKDVKRFVYFRGDIHDLTVMESDALNGAFHEPEKMSIGVSTSETAILSAMHACGNLSKHIIDLFLKSCAKHLILCPCCIGKGNGWIHDAALNALRMNDHDAWCLYLASTLHDAGIDDIHIIKDNHVLSPRNMFIVAHK